MTETAAQGALRNIEELMQLLRNARRFEAAARADGERYEALARNARARAQRWARDASEIENLVPAFAETAVALAAE